DFLVDGSEEDGEGGLLVVGVERVRGVGGGLEGVVELGLGVEGVKVVGVDGGLDDGGGMCGGEGFVGGGGEGGEEGDEDDGVGVSGNVGHA
ncbi:hypothetical protein, partial [Neisseria sicca]|uniref:hypothetical protein n=1 Tax=Neisseria sicca TaxID=490 RepID=UPI001C9A1C60